MGLCVCVYVCMRVCVYVCLCIWIYMIREGSSNVSPVLKESVCVCFVCVYVCMCVCVYVYMYIHDERGQ